MKTPNHPIYVSTKDYFKSQEPFDLVRDSSGEILITTPQPALEKMASYYQDQEYISHSDTGKGLIPFLYRLVQKRSLKQKVKLINKLSSHKGTLLDIGAGTGAFCQSMTQDSWQVYGVEPNENAREIAAKKKLFLHQNIQDFIYWFLYVLIPKGIYSGHHPVVPVSIGIIPIRDHMPNPRPGPI